MEIDSPVVLLRVGFDGRRHARQRMAVLDLHLQFFIVAVGKIAADAAHEFVVIERWSRTHIQLSPSQDIEKSSLMNVSVVEQSRAHGALAIASEGLRFAERCSRNSLNSLMTAGV